MIKLKAKELHFNEKLKKKIEFICDFCNTKPTIINGSIKNIEHTNLNYVELHRVIIKCITFLVFNYSKTIYVGSLENSLEIKDLESFVNVNMELDSFVPILFSLIDIIKLYFLRWIRS